MKSTIQKLALMAIVVASNSANSVVITDYRLGLVAPNPSQVTVQNSKTAYNLSFPAQIHHSPFATWTFNRQTGRYDRTDGNSNYIGVHNPNYFASPSNPSLPSSVTSGTYRFESFDSSLGTVLGATLNFDYAIDVFNQVKSLEWHYGGAVGARSNYNFNSGIYLNDGRTQATLTNITNSAGEALCFGHYYEGNAAFGLGDGDDRYCDDRSSRTFRGTVQLNLNASYIDSLVNGNLSMIVNSYIGDWSTSFGGGDDLRFAAADLRTSVINSYLNITYDDGIEPETELPVISVSEPSTLALLGLGLTGLGLARRRAAR